MGAIFLSFHTYTHNNTYDDIPKRARDGYWEIYQPFCMRQKIARHYFPPAVYLLIPRSHVVRFIHSWPRDTITSDTSPLGFLRDRGGSFISADAYDITIWIFQAYSMILHSQPSVIYMHLRTKSFMIQGSGVMYRVGGDAVDF